MKRAAFIACVVLGIACGKLALGANGPQAIWIDVPYVEQTKDGCGSAAISMVLQYWAKQNGQIASAEMDAGKIQEALYSTKQQGIPASVMEKVCLPSVLPTRLSVTSRPFVESSSVQ